MTTQVEEVISIAGDDGIVTGRFGVNDLITVTMTDLTTESKTKTANGRIDSILAAENCFVLDSSTAFNSTMNRIKFTDVISITKYVVPVSA